MGTPHYWDSVSRLFHRPLMCDRAKAIIHKRIKSLLGITKEVEVDADDPYNALLELNDYFGLGTERSRQGYLEFAEIDLEHQTCGPMTWCSNGELE